MRPWPEPVSGGRPCRQAVFSGAPVFGGAQSTQVAVRDRRARLSGIGMPGSAVSPHPAVPGRRAAYNALGG